jgi:regulator of replication initiation timing
MKKILTLLPLLLMLGATAGFAQKARESNEKSPAGEGNAVVIELEGQAKNVEDVMKKKFSKLKGKSEKGFEAFTGVIYSEISANTIDIYYKVEKKDETHSKIIMFLSQGYNNFMSSKDFPSEISNAIKLLDGMIAEVRKYELELAIAAQTKVVEDEVKTQEKLVEENEDLVKEKEKLTKELEENKTSTETNVKTQEEQKKKIEDQKKVLTELQGKLGQVK